MCARARLATRVKCETFIAHVFVISFWARIARRHFQIGFSHMNSDRQSIRYSSRNVESEARDRRGPYLLHANFYSDVVVVVVVVELFHFEIFPVKFYWQKPKV